MQQISRDHIQDPECYRTPSVLASIFPGHSCLCWRCGTQTGTLLNIFWECTRLSLFWQQVLQIIHKLTDVSLQDNPAAVLLNLIPMSCKRYRKSLLRHLLNAVRDCIPTMWKQQSPPVSQWFARVSDIQQMEHLTAVFGEREDELNTRWIHWDLFWFSDDYWTYTWATFFRRIWSLGPSTQPKLPTLPSLLLLSYCPPFVLFFSLPSWHLRCHPFCYTTQENSTVMRWHIGAVPAKPGLRAVSWTSAHYLHFVPYLTMVQYLLIRALFVLP